MLNLSFDYLNETRHIKPGVYFGLDEAFYHAIPALSSSALKNLQISAPEFYFNSWLNPNRAEDAEDEDSKEWRVFGRATHVRILEGAERFYQLYCVEFIAPEGCLTKIDDLKAYCINNAVDTKGSAKWNKPDWIKAVRFHNPNVMIYDIEAERYARETQGKIKLSAKQIRRIEIAAAMIEKNPELSLCFKDGMPEVSVIWYDDALELWFKARLDYLKPAVINDLKTFTNMRNKPIDQALHDEVENHRYHIQAVFYLRAVRYAVAFIRAGHFTAIGEHAKPPQDWLDDITSNERPHDFYFVFTKKGGAPTARAKKFSRNLSKFREAEDLIDYSIALFKEYYARFGNDIWVDVAGITEFADDDFPARRINAFSR